MFGTKQTLIVVYKDELLVNQLRKMVETRDDSENEVVGTTDDSINIVSWDEKVWLANKKAGNLQGKILFIGDVKGTDKLTPIVDVKFNEFGVSYGWAGNQAVIFADTKVLTTREDYEAFLKKYVELPIPDSMKVEKILKNSKESTERIDDSNQSSVTTLCDTIERSGHKPEPLGLAKKALSTGADALGKVGGHVAVKYEEIRRNKSVMMRQMLFYGVVNMYNNGLEEFMNT